MPRTRTFIAIGLPKAIRDNLVALQETLGHTEPDVKWVEPENLHLTLCFLGEVDDREIPNVCQLVAEVTAQRGPFTVAVEAAGCFPNARRPRILWAGIGAGADSVGELHDALEDAFEGLGYRREERRYTPHITLGRVRSDRPTQALAAALAARTRWKGGESTVQELLVMGSELTPDGPRYTVLSRCPLRR